MEKMYKLTYYFANILAVILIVFSSITSAGAQCSQGTAREVISTNQFSGILRNDGVLWQSDSLLAGFNFPIDSPTSVFFSGGILMSGITPGNDTLAAVSAYSNFTDFYPGTIPPSNMLDSINCNDFDKIWVIGRDEIQRHVNIRNSVFSFPIQTSSISQNILDWPGRGNTLPSGNTILTDLAPFEDYNQNGIYDPEWGDIPKIKGDSVFFWVFNDLGDHSASGGAPMNIEIHAMAYLFLNHAMLEHSSFYEYKFVNKSNHVYSNFVVSNKIDPDLGCWNDDYVGCHIGSQTGYAYNGHSFDQDCTSEGFGHNSPLVAVTFLNKELHSFNVPQNNSQHFPDAPHKIFRLQQSGSSMQHDLSGNPSNSLDISMCSLGAIVDNYHFLMSTKPTTLEVDSCLNLSWYTTIVPITNYSACPNIDSLLVPTIEEITDLYNDSLIHCNTYAITGISEIDDNGPDVRIYPNPAEGNSFISITTDQAIQNVFIADLSGKTVYDESPKSTASMEVEIDVPSLSTGVYLIRVDGDAGRTTRKLIIH